MSLRFRETPDSIIVYFVDTTSLDESFIQEFRRGMGAICQQAADAAKRLIIDFQGIQFMTPSMIGDFVLINKSAKQISLDLRLAHVGPNVLEVFKITRVNQVFRFDDGPEELGAPVPLTNPPGTDNGRANPPEH